MVPELWVLIVLLPSSQAMLPSKVILKELRRHLPTEVSAVLHGVMKMHPAKMRAQYTSSNQSAVLSNVCVWAPSLNVVLLSTTT